MGDDLTTALFSGPELRGGGADALVRRFDPDLVVGHGLGDLPALAAAAVLDPDDALELARVREQLIGRANAERGGGLLAVVGADADDAARRLAARSGAHVARHDSPLRVILAGTHEQLGRARTAAQPVGIAVEDVDAAAALHCAAMAQAARRFDAVLQTVTFHEPRRTVLSSVTAAPMSDPRAELAAGLERPVLWRETVRALAAAGSARYVEAEGRSALGDLVLETLSADDLAAREPELLTAV